LYPSIFTTVSGKAGDCLNQEMQSLLAFKNGLHDPAGRLASWNVSFSCCHWEGVSCDSRTGGVVAVDLHNCSLSGIFRPAALFNLTALEHLDVSFNNFTGLPIPTEMGFLKNLKYLNLSTAGFAGTIPWQLGNLSNLTGLDLSSSASMLTSPDLSWLANLTALTNLSLNGVDLSATSSSWGQSVSRLSQLLNLTMSNCGLTGSIPPSLQKLRYLETLHLDGNTFQS
jgi:Leucine-rich repeat (LRR) protein